MKKQIILHRLDDMTGYWTDRALERIGFYTANEPSEGLLAVWAGKDQAGYQWKVTGGNSEKVFRSLYELTAYLTHIR